MLKDKDIELQKTDGAKKNRQKGIEKRKVATRVSHAAMVGNG